VDVKGITNEFFQSHDANNRKIPEQSSENQGKKLTDKIEISDEAKKLYESSRPVKDLSAIKERIETKYYDSDDVIGKVADQILKALKGS